MKLKAGVAGSEEWIPALDSGSCARPRHQGLSSSRSSCHPDHPSGDELEEVAGCATQMMSMMPYVKETQTPRRC